MHQTVGRGVNAPNNPVGAVVLRVAGERGEGVDAALGGALLFAGAEDLAVQRVQGVARIQSETWKIQKS